MRLYEINMNPQPSGGQCVLCGGSVRFVIDTDKEPVYRKAPDAHERLVNWFQFMTANPSQSGDEFNKNIETAISLVLVPIGGDE